MLTVDTNTELVRIHLYPYLAFYKSRWGILHFHFYFPTIIHAEFLGLSRFPTLF